MQSTILIINMKRNDKFKKTNIKNWTCYYFHDISKFEDFNFHNILLDQISHENDLVYDI